jgi:dsDNA-specific endonuclease/ATPase MutS2
MSTQKLKPKAARDKAIRDKAAAMTDDRRNKKAENQRKRRQKLAELTKKYSAAYAKKWLKLHDYDHNCNCWKTIKDNRGNDGKGTKMEGKKK